MIFFIAVALLYWTVSECYEFKEIDVILILAASIMASGVSFILHCIMEKVLVEQRLE